MPTLYYHIGTHKTGSTAIQFFCEENRRALEKRGYCFPLFPYKYKKAGIRQNGYFLVGNVRSFGRFNKKLQRFIRNRCMRRIVKLFRRYPNIILSDEATWRLTKFRCPKMWKRLKKDAKKYGFDVKILVYLRRQDQFLSSWWTQAVKVGRTPASKVKWKKICANPENYVVLDYYKHLEEIAAVFGRENIIVRVYDRGQFKGGDIIPDFLDAVGLSMEDDFVIRKEDPNPSLSGNTLEIQRIINSLPHYSERTWPEFKAITAACSAAEKKKRTYSLFSEEEQKEFLARYEESNRLVARDYLGQDAPLFRPPEKLPPKWEEGNSHMYEVMIRYFGEAMLMQKLPVRMRWLRSRVKDLAHKAGLMAGIVTHHLFR